MRKTFKKTDVVKEKKKDLEPKAGGKYGPKRFRKITELHEESGTKWISPQK